MKAGRLCLTLNNHVLIAVLTVQFDEGKDSLRRGESLFWKVGESLSWAEVMSFGLWEFKD